MRYIYNDTVTDTDIATHDMVLPPGRYTYSFYMTGDSSWQGDGVVLPDVRRRSDNTVLTLSHGYDSTDTYNSASKYYVTFCLTQKTKLFIETVTSYSGQVTWYKPKLTIGYDY